MTTGYNNCTVEVYSRFSTTPVIDPSGDLTRCTIVSFDSFYPGGLWGSAEIVVPRDPTRGWLFKQGQRLVIRNGLAVCFEGEIVNPGYFSGPGREGRTITAIGFWGALLGRRGLRKPWCDMRVDDAVWARRRDDSGDDKCDITRHISGIEFIPKGVAWADTQYANLRYTAPTGQTVKRVTFAYDFGEGGQAWELALRNVGTSTDVVSITATATGTTDHTLATPSQSVELRFYARAAQTPTEDGTYYARVTSIKVYTETSSINPTEIATDWVGAISQLNSGTAQIASNTLTLEPWITNGYEWAADNLARLAAMGDASFNAWAAYVLESEAAASPDGKPVLALQQQPALSDYDYAVRLDDPNVSGDLELRKTDVYNWIVVTYTDELGVTRYTTPDDNANLTDATSASETTGYGRREYVLSGTFTSAAAALGAGRRFLAQHKDEHLYVSGALAVVGYIRAKNGQPVPASLIRAGKRVKVENFLSDEVGTSGAGVTAIISSARYTDADETASLSFGVPDDLAVILAQMAAGMKGPGMGSEFTLGRDLTQR